jgi:glycosyltransferase involved in cell wall biosynthesis
VIEAMSLRCPVIAADAGALPEVAADAALLFDPRSVDSLREALSRVALDDEALRESLVRKGVERAKAFSWDRCADETLAVYRSLAP